MISFAKQVSEQPHYRFH